MDIHEATKDGELIPTAFTSYRERELENWQDPSDIFTYNPYVEIKGDQTGNARVSDSDHDT